LKTIQLPIYGITVNLGEEDTESSVLCYFNGTVSSGLKEKCHCGAEDCKHEDSPRDYNIGIDVLESFILALAVAGVDIEQYAVIEAIETVVDKIVNKYDS
jgi:hypothetical protein